MTDVQLSACCRRGFLRAPDGIIVCRQCRQPCDLIWEVIIWDDDDTA